MSGATTALRHARLGRRGAAVLDVAVWVGLAGIGFVCASRWLGWSRPSPLVLAQGVLPYWFALSAVLATVTVLRRRWGPAIAAVVAILATGLPIWPAVSGPAAAARTVATGCSRRPDAPPIRIAFANVYALNDQRPDGVQAVLRQDADVVLLAELTPNHVDMFDRSGGAEYVHRTVDARWTYSGIGMFSRLPLVEPTREVIGSTPVLGADIAGLRLLAVHPSAPLTSAGAVNWKASLREYGRRTSASTCPLAIVGDFNATRWHPPFARLLKTGLRDAHEAKGKGLTRSWPTFGFGPLNLVGRVMRLDHALVNQYVDIVDVRDFEVPGSDHLGLVVTVR